jgi:hypothetical protein
MIRYKNISFELFASTHKSKTVLHFPVYRYVIGYRTVHYMIRINKRLQVRYSTVVTGIISLPYRSYYLESLINKEEPFASFNLI